MDNDFEFDEEADEEAAEADRMALINNLCDKVVKLEAELAQCKARIDEIYALAKGAEHPNRADALDDIIMICERAGATK